ncbi:MAG: nicotinate-nucleotide adenylyltransferase [Saprospiraceae bacterium]|jgi:nicotinate-nucleotide adenylyltransferase|tara:strand:+ start:730 stop:1410 length:681 start_codon:yes stop_codon:yes gene_type:complete
MPLKSGHPVGVGLFGGTFDPIHTGHLRIALEIKQRLHLREMRMIPCARPPHRSLPFASPGDRLAMLDLALSEQSGEGLIADNSEYRRAGPSYTLDTVSEIRTQLGASIPICLCLGVDSFASINTWTNWRDLIDIAHIVVAKRPGWGQIKNKEIVGFIQEHKAASSKEFHETPAGKIFVMEVTPLSISSTAIRKAILHNESVSYLVPETVAGYIKKNKLYQTMQDAL